MDYTTLSLAKGRAGRVITYSVLDGWRLVFAHDRRHVEQARGVMRSPGFQSLDAPSAWNYEHARDCVRR